jgi:hypothetical protein
LLRRISDQLTQITAELAAVKQRVADQQHAMDQNRQDATAAISNGLAEIRAVARDALARTNDTVTGPVANIGSELVALRGAVAQLDGQLRTAAASAAEPPAPERVPTPVEAVGPETAGAAAPPRTPPERQPHASDEEPSLTLRAAAGVSAAVLHAHRDTWEFLVKHAGADQHFHVPGAVAETAGTVCVHLSGPSLVAVLTSLDDVRRDPAAGIGTQAIAHHLHQRIGDLVRKIARDPHTGSDSDPVTIRIDDRLKPEDEADGDEAEEW